MTTLFKFLSSNPVLVCRIQRLSIFSWNQLFPFLLILMNPVKSLESRVAKVDRAQHTEFQTPPQDFEHCAYRSQKTLVRIGTRQCWLGKGMDPNPKIQDREKSGKFGPKPYLELSVLYFCGSLNLAPNQNTYQSP